MIVDRIEGDLVFLEDQQGVVTMQRSLLPIGVQEGDVLVVAGDGYAIDDAATNERRMRMLSLREQITRAKGEGKKACLAIKTDDPPN